MKLSDLLVLCWHLLLTQPTALLQSPDTVGKCLSTNGACRELAMQLADQFRALGAGMSLSVRLLTLSRSNSHSIV